MTRTHSETGIEDGWPWSCARCGRTIYHDAVHCNSCDEHSRDVGDPGGRLTASVPVLGQWVEWIDDQSYSSFVAKSSAIAGIELLLTALWIRVLFLGSLAVPTGVPI